MPYKEPKKNRQTNKTSEDSLPTHERQASKQVKEKRMHRGMHTILKRKFKMRCNSHYKAGLAL